jgi:hypothetical protein
MASVSPITVVGQGYSVFQGSALNNVLQGEVTNGSSGELEAKIHVCTSTEEVLDALNINASAEVSCPWGSFKDRLEFSRSMTKHTNSVVILAVASKVTGTTEIKSPKFSQSFESAVDLYEEGGDSYVATITLGGQYVASYQFLATDETSMESVKNVAETELAGGTVNFSAKLESAVTNIHSTTNVSFEFDQKAIGFSQGKLPNQNGINDFILAFGDKVLDNPAIVNFSLKSYRTITGHPKDVKQVDKNRDIYLDTFHTGKGLASIEERAQESQVKCANITDLYNHYGCLAVEPRFATVSKTLETIIAKIAEWREAIDEDPTSVTIQAPQIDMSTIVEPSAQYTLKDGPFCGSGGGGSFDDFKLEMIPKRALPSWVKIRGDEATDAITVGYTQQDQKSPQFDTGRHGGDGGTEFTEISFGPGEKVDKVKVKWSSDDGVVKVITIQTNKKTVSQPNSPQGDQEKEWTGTPGTECFVGFSGRSSRFLNALQVKYVEFSPAEWKQVPALTFSG